jgi:hypothetical protein
MTRIYNLRKWFYASLVITVLVEKAHSLSF